MSLDNIEAKLGADLNRYRSLKAKVKFDFGKDGHLFLDAAAMPPHLGRDDGEADCILTLSLENMEKLIAGKLDPMIAFTLGKLKVRGSKGIAMKLSALLEA